MESNNKRTARARDDLRSRTDLGLEPTVLYPGVVRPVRHLTGFLSQCKRPGLISLEMSPERVRANLAAKAARLPRT